MITTIIFFIGALVWGIASIFASLIAYFHDDNRFSSWLKAFVFFIFALANILAALFWH